MFKIFLSVFCVQIFIFEHVSSQIVNGAIAASNNNLIANNIGAGNLVESSNFLNPAISSQTSSLNPRTASPNGLSTIGGINNGITYGGVNGIPNGANNNIGVPYSAGVMNNLNGPINGVTNAGLSNGVLNNAGINYSGLNNGIPAYGALNNGVNIPYSPINGNGVPNSRIPYNPGNGPMPSAYSASGEGNMVVNGELPVTGSTSIYGQVPVNGLVRFNGNVAAGGIVSVSGSCGCGFNGP